MQQDLDRQVFDEYYNFLHSLSSIVSDFCFVSFSDKEAAFKSALSLAPAAREALSAKDHNFTQFLITLIQELNFSLSISFADEDAPTESLLSKLIEYTDFKLAFPPSGKPKINLTYRKLSSVVECLSLILELAKNDTGIYDIVRSSTNLAIPVIRLLKAIATDVENPYNTENIQHHILLPKQMLWNSLEQLLAEGSLFHVFGCISKDSFKEFFELMELNNREYAENTRDILKKLSKVGQNNALFSKLSSHLDEKKCLLSLWRSLKFHQERQTFPQKEAFLKYIIDNFSIGTLLQAPFISYDILNEVLLFLDLDLLSVLLSCTGESQDNVNYLQVLIDSVNHLSQFPLYIYGSAVEANNENLVLANLLPKGGHPNKHIVDEEDMTLKNCVFLKVLFDVIIKTSQDKKTWSWHYFLKEMNTSLLQCFLQSPNNYNILETTLKPFKFLVKTIHTCEYGCMIHSIDILDYLLTQVHHRNIEDDIFLLSVHLEKIKDVSLYVTLIDHILVLCQSNKKVLNAFSKDIHFLETIVNKLLSYIKQEQNSQNQISLDFARTLCSLILLLIEQNKKCLESIAKLSLIKTMLTSFQNNDENGDLQGNFIFFVNNILLLDLQCRERFGNIGQACSTLKSFQKNHLELTKNIFETFRHLKLHLDKVCMRKLAKEFELFDLVLELLERNFKDICVKDSEFYYIWDLLLDFLSTSNDVASYFSCKLQGFIKIVTFAKKYVEMEEGQKDKIIQQLILFSLYTPDHPDKGYVKIQSTIDLQSYANLTIKYPRLFREIYHTLILDNNSQYIKFLNHLLDAQPLNYRILDTCDFVEYLDTSFCDASSDFIFDLALKFFENAHSLSTLRVLSKHFIDENQLESSKDKSVLEAIQKKLALENQQAASISLKNDAAFDYQLLWVPKIHIPHPKHEENPNHALTFFTSLKLEHSPSETFTLFTLMSKSGSHHFKVYLNKQALNIQFKEQDIILDPQFLNKISLPNTEFTLALAVVAPSHLNPAVAAKQDTFLSFYLNGALVGDFSVKLNPTQSLFADNHYQLVIGSYEENKPKSTLNLQTFWMLKRSISIQEALSLHALTLLMGSSSNSLISDTIKFEFSKLGKQFSTEKLPFDFNLDKAIAFYSEATFSEYIFAEVAWSSILQDAVFFLSAENNIQRLENSHEVHSFLKEVPHLPSQSLIKNFHDKELLAFIPNLASVEEIGSHAFLMGFTHEKDINDYNSVAHESASKSLVKILEESQFLQVLLVKFLNSIRENNSQIIKDILAILISLYKKSQKARQYLIESNFLSFACNAFETAQNSQEQEHLLQIYQDLFIDINSNKDILLYSINAFKKIYESLDILASANNLVQTFGLNLLEKHLLKEDNKFFRWNIKSLREIQFAQMLINGLLVGRYTNISDNIYKIISILLWYRDDQCADLDCVSYIGDALGFLYFASGNTTNLLSPAKNKNFVAPFDDFEKKEESKENQEENTAYFNRKYLTLARQDLSYAQCLYQKLLATIIDLFVETTMRPLNIQLISLLLNIVFCYGDYDSHYKIITILFSYIPRFWQTGYEYNEEDDTDSEDEASSSPGLPNPAKSIWKAITTKTNFLMKNNNNPKSEEGQLKKTKSREKFLKGLYNYLKALLLIHGCNIEIKDATKLCNYLNMLGIHAETLFEPTYQEDAFLNCLLYQLLIYLISDGETRIKDKALAVMCCMLVHSKDTIKKALTYEKINLFDLGFQNLLKNKSNTSVISYSNFAQFITERTPAIQFILNVKLGPEWNKFTEQIRTTFEAGVPKQGQSQALILKDSPYHHHTILLPHLYLPSALIKTKTKNIPLISFFGKQAIPSGKQESNSMSNLDAGSEVSVSQKAVKERFDRAYVSLQYQNKCKRLASLTRENEINSFLKRNKKKTFLSSLQNTSNVAEITLTNYSWHLDTKNYPKGQRLKLQLKEHHTDKSQYERSPLKKPPSLSDQDILILPSDNPPAAQENNPKPRKRFLSASGRPSLKIEGELSPDDLLLNLQKVPNKEGSVHSLDEDEVLKMVEEVQSQTGTFRYNSVNRELDINEVIVSKYNCLFIDMQEKAECVFIVGRCSLYICTNYQLNKHGDIREVEPLDEKTITRLKWITPVKKEKLRKNESLSDLENEDDKQNYRSRSRTSFSELDQDYSESKPKIIRIPLEKILEVHARRYLLYPNAIEVFLDSGKSYFLAFNISFRNHCFTDIINAHAHYFNPNIDKLEVTLPKDSLFFASLSPELLYTKKKNSSIAVKIVSSPRFYIHTSAALLKQAVNLWTEGEISNFDYLMLLNTLSGRTLADLAQYPVFPWVIQQYQGESFKYSRKENYRLLAAPIGAMTPDRIDTVKKRFLETKESIMMSPYHYGSHYSSPGVMMYYFIRMFPFSQFSAHLQGGRFDFPNRLFSNIQSTFNLAQSIDFKELTPEFYSLPEFLVNLNRFYFGSAQEGTLIHHVVTAQWAKNNPRHFVQTMRRALESESSSRNINEWIDLIFGYKQRDKKAEEHLNLYHAITYEGVINLEGNNEFELECFLTQINEFGQCPKKLFDASHPQRKKMPHNSSFFASKEHLRHCAFVSLRDPVDHSVNRNLQVDRIKLKNDDFSFSSDSNQKCRVGLGSFQATPSLDEPETETVSSLKQSLMFAHKGYLLRGGKDNQLLNWNNPYKSLLLYSLEKERNVIRVFNSGEFEDITCANISKDGQLLILGNKYGRLTTFSFREQTLNNHILANPQSKDKKKLSASKKKTESQAKPSTTSEDIITKIRPEIQSEWAVEGIEVKDEKIKHSIFGSVVNKKKCHLEDFATRGSKSHRRSSKDANPKEDEVAFVNKYCKIHRSTEDESRDKTIKLIMENCVPEAHSGAITSIQISKSWNLMITADNKGICKIWDLNKSKLVKEIYTYHFKDSEIFDLCNNNLIVENEDYMITYLKQTTEREKVKSIVISESNGDFCVVSSHYVSVYTINGVLVSTFSTKQNKLPPLKSALLTRSQYSYEESCLILGHKKGLLTFWIFKENSRLKNLKEVKQVNQQDDVLAGKYGHYYDLSTFINKAIPLNSMVKVFESEVPSVVQDHHIDLTITSLAISADQTKLLVAVNTGEIFCFKKPTDSNANQSKTCGWCSTSIGLVDARIICAVCQKTYCINCSTLEESVNSSHLWKKVRLCPQCSVQSNSKSTDTLYDFY